MTDARDTPGSRATVPWIWLAAALLGATTCWIYLPGLDGPYLADDYPNLVRNPSLRPATLSFESLREAAFSFQSGTLYRPVAMASFALTYHWAGSDSPYALKAANLAIHLLTGLLLFLLARRLLPRLACVDTQGGRAADRVALFVAAWWLLHPLHVSTVLYSVQRMTGLSALFMVAGVYAYTIGRERMLHAGRGYAMTFFAVPAFGLLALLSKENGGLLPVLLLCIELGVFGFAWRDGAPRWARLALPLCLWLPVILLAGYLTMIAIQYTGVPISDRPFTLGERVLTETRVLWIYLGWLLRLPIRPLSFYHDDLAISHGLTDPLTTLFACAAWSAVLIGMVYALRRPALRYIGVGIGWFLGLQLLESTVIPLELIWEHRSYLSVYGPMLAAGVLIYRLILQAGRGGAWIAGLTAGLLLALNAMELGQRVRDWQSRDSLSESLVLLNPASPRAWSGLASDLLRGAAYPAARLALENAATAAPLEPGYPIGLAVADCLDRKTPAPALRARILDRLARGVVTAFTYNQFEQYIERCVLPAQRYDATTLPIIAAAAESGHRLLDAGAAFQAGRAARLHDAPQAAARYWEQVRALDDSAVAPRLQLAEVYLELRRHAEARAVLDELATLTLSPAQAAQAGQLRKRLDHDNVLPPP